MANVDYSKVELMMNNLVCPVHSLAASLIVDDTGPIFFNCCCTAFEELLYVQYYAQVAQQLAEDAGE